MDSQIARSDVAFTLTACWRAILKSYGHGDEVASANVTFDAGMASRGDTEPNTQISDASDLPPCFEVKAVLGLKLDIQIVSLFGPSFISRPESSTSNLARPLRRLHRSSPSILKLRRLVTVREVHRAFFHIVQVVILDWGLKYCSEHTGKKMRPASVY